jgi:hypothetical protein
MSGRFLMVSLLGLAGASASAGVFVPNAGTASQFGALEQPYAFLGADGSLVWEQYRKLAKWGSPPDDPYPGVVGAQDPLVATRVNYSGLNQGENNSLAVAPGTFFSRVGGSSTPGGADALIPQLVRDAAGNFKNTSFRIGFMESAGVANFINSGNGDGAVSPANTGDPDPNTWGRNVDFIYAYVDVLADGTINTNNRVAAHAANTTKNEGTSANALASVVGTLAGTEIALSASIAADGLGNAILTVQAGAVTLTSSPISLSSAPNDDGVGWEGGSFDLANLTPFVFYTDQTWNTNAAGTTGAVYVGAVPEPASLALVSAMSLLLLRRRG